MSQLRILVVGAHPADVFDQSGGTMAHHAARGDTITCVVLTHGARVHDKVVCDEMFRREQIPLAADLNLLIKERSDVKGKEVLEACKLLGVSNVYFLGADDAILLVNETVIRQLARLMRKLRPNIVLTHFPKEDGGVGGPHAVTGQIVMYAMQLASSVEPGDPNPPTRIAQVFFFGLGAAAPRQSVWGSEGGYYNDVFVDITDVAEKKLAAIDKLVSQGYAGPLARKWIEASEGAFGIQARVAYAEGFITMRSETHYYLPLSELDYVRSFKSDHEITGQMSYRISLNGESRAGGEI